MHQPGLCVKSVPLWFPPGSCSSNMLIFTLVQDGGDSKTEFRMQSESVGRLLASVYGAVRRPRELPCVLKHFHRMKVCLITAYPRKS